MLPTAALVGGEQLSMESPVGVTKNACEVPTASYADRFHLDGSPKRLPMATQSAAPFPLAAAR